MSEINLIEVHQGQCKICHTKHDLVGIQFRAAVIRFCCECLFLIGDAIQKLKEQKDAKTKSKPR
jgi:hypothetical protein